MPAGHEYRDWQVPRVPSRILYFYFDLPVLAFHSDHEAYTPRISPRLFFRNATLWETALKLKGLIESPASDNQPYLEALGAVLAHEVTRLDRDPPHASSPTRGGLAAWQERTVTAYIEEHLAEQLSLATLSQLARLSSYYFCRAFKQSFGAPPHRYQINRRIERAKLLLADRDASITDIGFRLGFSQTSSFTAAFRKAAGITPSAYRRGLA